MAIANVLLADDEVPFVKTMTKRLSKRGLHITPAFSGQEALDTLEKDRGIERSLSSMSRCRVWTALKP